MHNPITYACTLLALAHSTLASPNTLFPRANDTSPPNQTCQAARSQVQTVCDDINLLSYELQSIQLCPPAGNETHYADLIRQALQTILGYERQQNDTSLIAAEERAATALLGLFNVTVTDQDAILPLLVGAAEAVYPDVCAVAVEVGVLEGYCTEGQSASRFSSKRGADADEGQPRQGTTPTTRVTARPCRSSPARKTSRHVRMHCKWPVPLLTVCCGCAFTDQKKSDRVRTCAS